MAANPGASFAHLPTTEMVQQEHPNGCGIACIAMVAGLSYSVVRDELGEFLPREPDYGEEGIHHGIMEWFLGRRGFAWLTLYLGHHHSTWPPEPFAPVHIAHVVQPSRNSHYVVVKADGTVLDPLDGGTKRLTDWDRINNVMGFWRVLNAAAMPGGVPDEWLESDE